MAFVGIKNGISIHWADHMIGASSEVGWLFAQGLNFIFQQTAKVCC